ncbi:hypothetical protein G6O69_29290 [Pseudenhygromyxa sp. WMMC2535]|uniref:hypothetical protein n=1 Tax=Pseudenhygromyxa sp. WMMC2535 TaxID=2712867 RepID=UPI001553BFFB|nr:hypothetical protein [Pseudenhygromyxa sp. WMMC2535]NVB41959.1 hypothetical protein [Pseudenhygromyxa sp. WMMC2535]
MSRRHRATTWTSAVIVALACLLGAPASAAADEPSSPASEAGTSERPLALAPMLAPALPQPTLTALPALPASFGLPVPVLAAREKKERSFDTSMGEVDPRTHDRPRTHRFRLAIQSHWVRLTRVQNPDTGESERFHYAPMHIDLGYQAQFLKYVMVRVAVGLGGNVANTRNAMPASVFPQAYAGYQGKLFGAAFGYGFDWTIPPTDGATASSSFALPQPVIRRNHVVMGELSVTSRVDRVALTFALALGGMKSQLTHFNEANNRFRFYLGLHAGAFFDGTIRREKKARKQAAAEGR